MITNPMKAAVRLSFVYLTMHAQTIIRLISRMAVFYGRYLQGSTAPGMSRVCASCHEEDKQGASPIKTQKSRLKVLAKTFRRLPHLSYSQEEFAKRRSLRKERRRKTMQKKKKPKKSHKFKRRKLPPRRGNRMKKKRSKRWYQGYKYRPGRRTATRSLEDLESAVECLISSWLPQGSSDPKVSSQSSRNPAEPKQISSDKGRLADANARTAMGLRWDAEAVETLKPGMSRKGRLRECRWAGKRRIASRRVRERNLQRTRWFRHSPSDHQGRTLSLARKWTDDQKSMDFSNSQLLPFSIEAKPELSEMSKQASDLKVQRPRIVAWSWLRSGEKVWAWVGDQLGKAYRSNNSGDGPETGDVRFHGIK